MALGLALGAGTLAHAYGPKPWPHDPGMPGAPSAPEVDPSLAIGGITLVAGALTVMRAGKRK
jgi:hypothetical protein